MRASTPRSEAEAWPQPPPIAVFIRNLKLLRLDLRPDWPNIVPSTLSDSQSNLRRRVQAVEWALFYLFQLWDPILTRDKLQPFFPPLEPLQSSNLRAALFRLLSDLTKNGTLGRERILRKAMLEECSGEKFDEILAEFSTIVLQKVVSSSGEHRAGAPSLSLPTSKQRAPPNDTQNLLPLIIAYRASLNSMINQKNELNSTCRDLKQFLHLKSNELANSRRVPKPLASDTRNQQQFQDSVKRSWHGDMDWATTVFNGDSQASSEPLLEMDFSEVWSGMKKVEVKGSSNAQSQPNLLADLEDRLSKQRSRLQKWQSFKKSLDLDNLRGRLQPAENLDQPPSSPEPDTNAAIKPDCDTISQGDQTEVAEDILEAETPDSLLTAHPEPRESNVSEVYPGCITKSDADVCESKEPSIASPEIPTTDTSTSDPTDPGRDISEMSTEDMLARQLGLSPLVKSNTTKDCVPKLTAEDRVSRATTLLERTRQSMLFVSASTPRPWKPASDTRRQSQLLLPGDPFETPEKRAENKGNPELELTEQNDPYSDYVDYDSVFRSRPKIASSPTPIEPPHPEEPDVENPEDDHSFSELALENSPLGKMQGRPRTQTIIRYPFSNVDDRQPANSEVDPAYAA